MINKSFSLELPEEIFVNEKQFLFNVFKLCTLRQCIHVYKKKDDMVVIFILGFHLSAMPSTLFLAFFHHLSESIFF